VGSRANKNGSVFSQKITSKIMSKERILKKEITLPYSGQLCKIYRLKAKDVNAAQKMATSTIKKLDGKESTNVDTGKLMLILLSRACTFDDAAITPEEIEELDSEDYAPLMAEAGGFLGAGSTEAM
jgi:hypothetical protein